MVGELYGEIWGSGGNAEKHRLRLFRTTDNPTGYSVAGWDGIALQRDCP